MPATTTTTTLPTSDGPVTYGFERLTGALTAPGDSVVVHVGATDADGKPTGNALPAGTTYEVLGDDASVTVADLGGGAYRATATADVGSIVLAVRIPGQDQAAFTTIMNVRLQPGVHPVADQDVVFPPPNRPAGENPVDAGLPGITATGVGPFPIAAVAARASFDDTAAADLDQLGEVHIPWVLRGAPPATGSLVYGVGGSGLLGRVIEPAGLPTLTGSGLSLVTVALSPLNEIFADVRWHLTQDELTTAHVMPLGTNYVYSCPADVAAADCPDPTLTEAKVLWAGNAGVAEALAAYDTVSSGDTPPISGAGSGGGTQGFANAPTGPAGKSRVPKALPGECKSANADSALEFKVLGSQFVGWNLGGGYFNSFTDFRAAVGLDIKLSAGITGRAQAKIKRGVECQLEDLGEVRLAEALMGPWGALLTPYMKVELDYSLDMQTTAGPRVDFGTTCKVELHPVGGIEVTASHTGIVGQLDPKYGWDKCSMTGGFVLGSDDDDVSSEPAQLELTGYGYLKFPIGFAIGGSMLDAVLDYVGKGDLNDVNMLAAQAGPRIKLFMENRDNVVAGKDPKSGVTVDLYGQVTVDNKALNWAISYLSGLPVSGTKITLLEGSLPIGGVYPPLVPKSNSVVVSGNEQGLSGTVEVVPGDHVTIHSTMKYKDIGLALGYAAAEGGSLWEIKGPIPKKIRGVQVLASGAAGSDQLVTFAFDVDQALCDEIGDEAIPVRIIADTTMLVVPAPGYGGELQVRCLPPKIELDKHSLIFDTGATDSTSTVQITQQALAGRTWQVAGPNSGPLPAWITVTPVGGGTNTGTFPLSGNASFTVKVDCNQVDPKDEVDTTIVVKVLNPPAGTAKPITDQATVSAECRDTYVKFQPKTITGSGHVTLKTDGVSTGVWKFDSASAKGAPKWLKNAGGTLAVTPVDGVYGEGVHTEQLGVTVASRAAICDDQAARSYTLKVVTEYRSGPQEDRGSASLTVTQPAVPGTGGPGCRKPHGKSTGDPHLTSFDGQYFDAQVLGEYTYVTPVAGASGPTLQVRHELTAPQGVSAVSPTSVTAIALSTQGRLLEVYSRPSFIVRLDGITQTLADGVPSELAPGFSVTRTGSSVRIVADDIDLTASLNGSILDLGVEMPLNTAVHGLLGTPNGNAADDLVGADGTAYGIGSLWDLSQGSDSAVYRLSDSWRLHDEAASLFTLPYDGFHDLNPRLDPAVLAAARAQVEAQLGALNAVCDGTSSNIVDSLALELAIRGQGATIADVAGFSCSYYVTGTASAPSPGSDVAQGLGGLKVSVDGVGLTACTTTTAADGSYTCELRPALDEISSPDPLDVTAQVTARWPGDPADAFTGNVEFTDRAAIGSTRRATADIDIAAGTLPAVDVNGTMLRDGGPVTTPVLVVLQAFDGAGALVATYRQQTLPAANGTYSLVRVMPRAATRVVATAQVGVSTAEWFNAETTALTPGSMSSLRLDVDLTAPTVVIAGTLKLNGRPVTKATDIEYRATRADGANVVTDRIMVTPNPATGAYTTSITLPRSAVNIDLVAYVGLYWDAQTRSVRSLQVGANPVQWDIDLRTPELAVSGTILRNGVPVTTPTGLTTYLYDGTFLRTVYSYTVTPDAQGHYSINVLAISSTTRAVLYLEMGTQPGDRFPADVTGLTPGVRAVTLDADVRPPTLTLTGHLQRYGAALAGSTNLYINTDDGAGGDTGNVYLFNVPLAADGSFTTAAQLLPARARHAVVYVVNNSLVQTESFAIDLVAGTQTKQLELDERPASVRIHGHVTGDGITPGSTLRLDVVRWANGVEAGIPSYYVTLGQGGAFDLTVQLPTNVTNVQVLGIFSGFRYSTDLPRAQVDTPSGVPTPVDVPIEFDYRPSRLTLTGKLLVAGRPLTEYGHFELNAYDGGGNLLSRLYDQYPSADPDDGSYRTNEVLLPLGTARVDVVYLTTISDIDREWRGSIGGLTDGQPLTRNLTVDFDKVAGNIHAAGTVLIDGATPPAGTELPVFITVYTRPEGAAEGEETEPHYLTPSIVVDEVGRYELDEQFTPDEADVVDSINVYVGMGDGAWLELTADQLGTLVEWNIEISMTKLVVSGRVTVDGQPFHDDGVYGTADDLRFEGAQFEVDPTRSDGYQATGGFSGWAPRSNADGSFAYTKTFPRNTEVIVLVATVAGRSYTRRVDIHQPVPGEGPSTVNVDWDIDIDTSTVNVVMDASLICSAGQALRPQLLDATVWAFPTSVDGSRPWEEQGTPVATTAIVPEWNAEEGVWSFRLRVDVPAGTVDVGLRYQTAADYPASGPSFWGSVGGASSTAIFQLGEQFFAPTFASGSCVPS